MRGTSGHLFAVVLKLCKKSVFQFSVNHWPIEFKASFNEFYKRKFTQVVIIRSTKRLSFAQTGVSTTFRECKFTANILHFCEKFLLLPKIVLKLC